MARAFTPTDAHLIITSLYKQATGQEPTVAVTDTSSFVSAGEEILSTGPENVLNSLGIVLGRTYMAVRPYDAKLRIINALDTGLYTNRFRKISVYSRTTKASGWFNTDLNPNNLADGVDNNSGSGRVASMWEQNKPVPLEVNFAGQDVWDDWTTVYENQLKVAFTNEQEFIKFMSGIMTVKSNDIEHEKEAFNRLTLLNKIAGIYDLKTKMPKACVNLTKEFNTENGTNYTSQELRTTHLRDFLAFFVEKFKVASDYMTEDSTMYHWAPDKPGYALLRHTPKDKQRAILYGPLFTKAEANVLPEIFNPQYLDIDKGFEPVNYWQNINEPTKIDITPAIPNTTSPTAGQVKGANVKLDYVVGILYDEDSLMTDFQFEGSYTTPIEARKGYRNIFWHFSKNAINDFTENAILFYMADEPVSAKG